MRMCSKRRLEQPSQRGLLVFLLNASNWCSTIIQSLMQMEGAWAAVYFCRWLTVG
jgi:hypothetical protein